MSLNKEPNPCDYCNCTEANKCEETIEEDRDKTSQEEEEKDEASSQEAEEEEEEEEKGEEEEEKEDYKKLVDPRDNHCHVATCITFALPCVVLLLNFVQLDHDYFWNLTF